MRRSRAPARRAAGALVLLAAAVRGACSRSRTRCRCPRASPRPPSVVVEYRDGSPAHVFLAPDERWRVPHRLARSTRPTCRALLALEDKRFYSHPGVDPLAVARALWLNITRGRRVSGASTLTMQLVRVLEPRPRTLRSKALESLRAAQLELRLSQARDPRGLPPVRPLRPQRGGRGGGGAGVLRAHRART